MSGSFLAGAPAVRIEAPKWPICGVALVPRRSTYLQYASLLETSGALHLDLFDLPEYKNQPLRGSDRWPVKRLINESDVLPPLGARACLLKSAWKKILCSSV
jgi:hypothetical protein